MRRLSTIILAALALTFFVGAATGSTAWAADGFFAQTDNRQESAPPDEPAPAEETMAYVVQAGDHLSQIAATFRTSLARLAELNRINPGQRLAAGRELLVPKVIHRVQAGDSLGTIAKRYRTTARALSQANPLSDPSLIVPGQEIVIVPPTLAERVGLSTAVDEAGYHAHTDFLSSTERWIDVDLSEQRVVAYAGTVPVRSFIVSTGLPGTPTVTGTFRIWAKTTIQDMSGGNRAAGDYYYLKDVQWVQYFYEDYAFHGTYWHNNFGRPMSRGCVNMTNDDAKWLFDWASPAQPNNGWLFSDSDNPGTLVMVHQ
jgi:lipoprotein-anchoring transpeptidase ErfK/SrfK